MRCQLPAGLAVGAGWENTRARSLRAVVALAVAVRVAHAARLARQAPHRLLVLLVERVDLQQRVDAALEHAHGAAKQGVTVFVTAFVVVLID